MAARQKQGAQPRWMAPAGFVAMMAVAGYIAFGGNPSIDQAAVKQRLESLSQSLAKLPALAEFSPSVTISDIKVSGWGYDRVAHALKPQITWRYDGVSWQLKAASMDITQHKLQPERWTFAIHSPVELLRDGVSMSSLRYQDALYMVLSDTGHGSLRVVEARLALPSESVFEHVGGRPAVLGFQPQLIIHLTWMPESQKLTLSASADQMEITQDAISSFQKLQLSLLDNRASDGTRLGYGTFAIGVLKQDETPAYDVAMTAEYRADEAYRQIAVDLKRLALMEVGKSRDFSGQIKVSRLGKIGGELTLMPEKKTVSISSLDAIINAIQPPENKGEADEKKHER